MSTNDEHFLAKMFIVIFVFEIIGIILALAGTGTTLKTTAIRSTTADMNNTVYQIQNLTSNKSIINFIQINAVSASSNPVGNCNLFCFLTGVGNYINNLVILVIDVLIFLINLVIKAFLILWNIVILLAEMLYLLLSAFVLLLALFTSTGIVGYILGLGYVFVLGFLIYKFGNIILQFFGAVFGVLAGMVGRFI